MTPSPDFRERFEKWYKDEWVLPLDAHKAATFLLEELEWIPLDATNGLARLAVSYKKDVEIVFADFQKLCREKMR